MSDGTIISLSAREEKHDWLSDWLFWSLHLEDCCLFWLWTVVDKPIFFKSFHTGFCTRCVDLLVCQLYLFQEFINFYCFNSFSCFNYFFYTAGSSSSSCTIVYQHQFESFIAVGETSALFYSLFYYHSLFSILFLLKFVAWGSSCSRRAILLTTWGSFIIWMMWWIKVRCLRELSSDWSETVAD
jgi:hypothetical protein